MDKKEKIESGRLVPPVKMRTYIGVKGIHKYYDETRQLLASVKRDEVNADRIAQFEGTLERLNAALMHLEKESATCEMESQNALKFQEIDDAYHMHAYLKMLQKLSCLVIVQFSKFKNTYSYKKYQADFVSVYFLFWGIRGLFSQYHLFVFVCSRQ